MRKLLMGMTCYGAHVDTFFRYCLPSLMAPGNIPAMLDKYDVRFAIHTDAAGAEDFKDFPLVRIDVDTGDKYQMLARHQANDLLVAKNTGSDYHLLMPDFVYSDNCFRGVMQAYERGHTAIARLVISTAQEDIAPELNRPRSSMELATLSLKHIHPGVCHWVARQDGNFPYTHVLAWHSGNKLRICSPHATPVLIAHEVIKTPPINLPLDSILDLVIDGPIYYPQPEDGIAIIEISPLGTRQPDTKRVSLAQFIGLFKNNTRNSAAQASLFFNETVDEVLIDGDWTDEAIQKQKELIIGALNRRYL